MSFRENYMNYMKMHLTDCWSIEMTEDETLDVFVSFDLM